MCAKFRDGGENDENDLRKELVGSKSQMSATILHQEMEIVSFDMTMYPFP